MAERNYDIDTYAGYTSKDEMFFSSTEHVWHSRILKLKEEHPDEVTIIKLPEENDGVIYAKMPVKWLKIQPKRTRDISNEEREEMRDRMTKLRAKQRNTKASSNS